MDSGFKGAKPPWTPTSALPLNRAGGGGGEGARGLWTPSPVANGHSKIPWHTPGNEWSVLVGYFFINYQIKFCQVVETVHYEYGSDYALVVTQWTSSVLRLQWIFSNLLIK